MYFHTHVYKWVFENPIRLHDPVIARLKKGRASRNVSFMAARHARPPPLNPLNYARLPLNLLRYA